MFPEAIRRRLDRYGYKPDYERVIRRASVRIRALPGVSKDTLTALNVERIIREELDNEG